MRNEVDELWSAMKKAKYRDTLAELHKIKYGNVDDISSLMNGLLSVVAKAVHAEVATLWYYSKFVDGLIHPKAVYGGRELKDFALSPGEGVAGYVIESGKGTLIEDCQEDQRWSGKADSSTGFVTKSMICVPVCDNNACFGCVQLINRTDGNLYDNNDYVFMESLAQEVAKILISYSGAFVRGVFDVFDDEKISTFTDVFSSRDEDELMRRIKKMHEYNMLTPRKASALARHCKAIWKLINKK